MYKVSHAKDDIYVNRYVIFHYPDGKKISSRDANFHQINLALIIMLELCIKGKSYRIRKTDLPSTFVEFIHFRSKGIKFIVNNENLTVPDEYNSWSIGWTDGAREYLCEVDFQTGNLIQNYDQPVSKARRTHFHPESAILEKGLNF